HFYPEVIDPDTGDVLRDGEVGELAFTSLTKEAMPVVRYRTRDLSRLLPGTARSFRRMEKVIGRSDDMMIVRGVNVFPSQIEEIILSDNRLSPHFVIELTREERLDAITVMVEARTEIGERLWRDCDRDLAYQIKSQIGISAGVRTMAPGSVERSMGKAKRVIDKRPKI
ncbi:MAG: phenylacetate--CoA ligase, partial [Pseudolabrys sp.]|nr:phenylacetate--CoA ligase [Pseudolabrys sp.]